MRQRLKQILKISIGLGLLALLLRQINIEEIKHHLQYISLPFVLFALLYYTGCQWLSCWRWQIILHSIGHKIKFSTLMSSYFGGMFLNTFLPSALGDGYRVYKVSQKSQDIEVAFVSVFLERATGLLALLALAVLGLPPAFQLAGRWDIILLFLLCTGILASGVLLMVSPRVLVWTTPLLHQFGLDRLLQRFARIQLLLRQFAQDRPTLASSLGLSFFLQLFLVYYYYLIAQQLKIPISYLELLVFVPIIVVMTLLPLPLGGLGFKEGLLAYLFNRIHLSTEQAVLLSLVITALGWVLSLPGSIILLLDSTGLQHIKRKSH